MSQRIPTRKQKQARKTSSSRQRQKVTRRSHKGLSIESLEARYLLSATELLPQASEFDSQPLSVAQPQNDSENLLSATSENRDAAPVAQANATPIFTTGKISNVTSTWQAVTLAQNYNSMVVVLTPNYDGTSVPLVPRMQVLSENSFEVRVDRTDGLADPVSGIDLHYLVVEEGVYNTAEHGVTMEAVTYTSTVTDRKSSWMGESRGYANQYNAPVVVGQVASYNDPGFSSFWARGGSRRDAPASTEFYTGKHIGEDANTIRSEETVGYLVIEAGDYTIGSTRLVAGLGSDTVRGINNAPHNYPASGQDAPSVAILSSAGMDGGDGGRPVLYGPNAVTATGLKLAIDEDQAQDSERRHATEQVAYLVFESVPNQAPDSIALDNQSVPENTPGAAVGQLQVTDPDVDDLHAFAVSDARFVVEGRLLKLTAETELDYETEPFVDLTITVTDSGIPPLSYSQSFSIAVEDVLEVTDDHANTPGSGATPLMLDSTGLGQATGVLEEAGDRDVFVLELSGTGSLKVELSETNSGLDTYLRVYDSQGTVVSENDDGDATLNSSVTFDAQGGTYYLEAASYDDAGAGTYLVNVVFTSDDDTNTNPGPPIPGDGYSIDVVFSDDSLTAGQQAVFTTAAARWSEVIVGDLPDVEVFGVGLVDDLLIYASAPAIDGAGGVLGQAAPTDFRDSWLPSSGFMEFDRDDLADMESSGGLIDLILHEMGHVIGIGTIWSEIGLLEDAGSSDPRFTGTAATQAYNEIFGNTENSVPVANTGGGGTADAHWREDIFANELMTGYLDYGSNPLSRVTVGALADIGYVVNLDAADDYTPSSLLERVEPISLGGTGEPGLYYAQQIPEGAEASAEKEPRQVEPGRLQSGWPAVDGPVGRQQEPTSRRDSRDLLRAPAKEVYSAVRADRRSSTPLNRPVEWGHAREVDALMESLSVDEGWVDLSWKGVG